MTFRSRFVPATALMVASLGLLSACDLDLECGSMTSLVMAEVPSPTSADLLAIDGSFIVGEAGTILHKAHRDADWSQLPSPTGVDLYGVAVTEPRAVIVGAAGMVMVSENRGESWAAPSVPTSADLLAVVRSSHSWVAVGDGVALRSTDAAEWSEVEVPGSARLNALVAGGGRLWAVGDAGAVLVSDDTGSSWQAVPVPTSADLHAVATGPERTTIVGAGGLVLTADAGTEDFEALDHEIETDLFGALDHRAVGAEGLIYPIVHDDEASADPADTEAPGGPTLRAIDRMGWAIVGDGGTIIEYQADVDAGCDPRYGG